MKNLEVIENLPTWKSLKLLFEGASTQIYASRVAGQCKRTVRALFAEVGNPDVLIAVHPAGSSNFQAFHSYGILMQNMLLADDPEDDVIVDATIGQIIPEQAPYVGRRGDLRNLVNEAFARDAINLEFLNWFSVAVATEKPVTSDHVFAKYYGDNSLNAFTNRPLERELS